MAPSTGSVEPGPALSDLVVRKTSEPPLSTPSVETNPAPSDVVEHEPDINSATTPSSDAVKPSLRFAPKPRGRDRSSLGPDSVSTQVESNADTTTTRKQASTSRRRREAPEAEARCDQRDAEAGTRFIAEAEVAAVTVEVVQMTGELSEREQVLRRLPLPYSLALRLRDAGVAAEVICVYLNVERAALDGFYRIAEAKFIVAQHLIQKRCRECA